MTFSYVSPWASNHICSISLFPFLFCYFFFSSVQQLVKFNKSVILCWKIRLNVMQALWFCETKFHVNSIDFDTYASDRRIRRRKKWKSKLTRQSYARWLDVILNQKTHTRTHNKHSIPYLDVFFVSVFSFFFSFPLNIFSLNADSLRTFFM